MPTDITKINQYLVKGMNACHEELQVHAYKFQNILQIMGMLT
jgi:hypothetical protein